MDTETLELLWSMLTDEQLELLWNMLTNEQLMELREKGAMDERTMQSFKTELFKRCLIEMDEAMDAFFGW